MARSSTCSRGKGIDHSLSRPQSQDTPREREAQFGNLSQQKGIGLAWLCSSRCNTYRTWLTAAQKRAKHLVPAKTGPHAENTKGGKGGICYIKERKKLPRKLSRVQLTVQLCLADYILCCSAGNKFHEIVG